MVRCFTSSNQTALVMELLVIVLLMLTTNLFCVQFALNNELMIGTRAMGVNFEVFTMSCRFIIANHNCRLTDLQSQNKCTLKSSFLNVFFNRTSFIGRKMCEVTLRAC